MLQDERLKSKLDGICKEDKPYPRKTCIREILDSLLIQQNDHHRLSVERKNLEVEYKIEMQRLEFPCEELKRVICCRNFDKTEGESFMQRLAQIHEIQNSFIKRLEELDGHIKEILEGAVQCWTALKVSQDHLKKSHQYYIEELKREAVRTTCLDEAAEYEKKICRLQKSFVEELLFINRAETKLQPFFNKLKSFTPPDYVQPDAFKFYKWLPEKKSFERLDEMLGKIKSKMGPSLVKAFTQMHLQKPDDVKGFLSSFLLNLERNQKLLKEKMELLKNKNTVVIEETL